MNTQNHTLTCPLCYSENSNRIDGPDKRIYYKCDTCLLIYVDSIYHPSKEAERIRYLAHENTIESTGYVNFLNKAISPAMQFLHNAMIGLDYGCGPKPTLSKLLAQQKIQCENFDPIFYPNGKTKQQYDYIFSTECFEHFFFPSHDIEKIISCLKKNGYLIVMTELWNKLEDFKTWSYPQDFTHSVFYHKTTIDWIATHFELKIVYCDEKRVIIFNYSF